MANDYEKALEILDRVGGEAQICAVCTGQDWAVGPAPQLLPVIDDAKHPIDTEGRVNLQDVRVISAACRNCGFIRLFHIDTLLKRDT
jgi:hypothetical protein